MNGRPNPNALVGAVAAIVVVCIAAITYLISVDKPFDPIGAALGTLVGALAVLITIGIARINGSGGDGR